MISESVSPYATIILGLSEKDISVILAVEYSEDWLVQEIDVSRVIAKISIFI